MNETYCTYGEHEALVIVTVTERGEAICAACEIEHSMGDPDANDY